MTIFQSDHAKGLYTPAMGYAAGDLMVSRFTYTFSVGAATTDIIELGILPAGTRIVDAGIVTEGTFTGITANIGIMSGTVGSKDTGRTSGSELFSAVNLATATSNIQRLTGVSGILLSPAETDRSIGLVVSGTVSAATSKVVTLLLFYAAPAA